MIKRIVILGPESTGKSTLSSQLAEYYNTLWVPEYAREHLEKFGTAYTYDDLLFIAKKQLDSEDRHAKKARSGLLFVDTDMYVMKVWCEFVFGRCHQWILDRIAEREYHLYLLCNTDLEWEEQPMREYPDPEPRNRLFHIYKDNMMNQHVPWKIVSGRNEQRLQEAIVAVNGLLHSNHP